MVKDQSGGSVASRDPNGEAFPIPLVVNTQQISRMIDNLYKGEAEKFPQDRKHGRRPSHVDLGHDNAKLMELRHKRVSFDTMVPEHEILQAFPQVVRANDRSPSPRRVAAWRHHAGHLGQHGTGIANALRERIMIVRTVHDPSD